MPRFSFFVLKNASFLMFRYVSFLLLRISDVSLIVHNKLRISHVKTATNECVKFFLHYLHRLLNIINLM
jgi:hypothetical protein